MAYLGPSELDERAALSVADRAGGAGQAATAAGDIIATLCVLPIICSWLSVIPNASECRLPRTTRRWQDDRDNRRHRARALATERAARAPELTVHHDLAGAGWGFEDRRPPAFPARHAGAECPVSGCYLGRGAVRRRSVGMGAFIIKPL